MAATTKIKRARPLYAYAAVQDGKFREYSVLPSADEAAEVVGSTPRVRIVRVRVTEVAK